MHCLTFARSCRVRGVGHSAPAESRLGSTALERNRFSRPDLHGLRALRRGLRLLHDVYHLAPSAADPRQPGTDDAILDRPRPRVRFWNAFLGPRALEDSRREGPGSHLAGGSCRRLFSAEVLWPDQVRSPFWFENWLPPTFVPPLLQP